MKLKIGVVGAGHLGKFHIEKLNSINEIEFMGFYEQDAVRREYISSNLNVKKYQKLEKLLDDCDAVTIATPTTSHYYVAKDALNMNCHVFIEKPITSTIQEADLLLKLANKQKKIIQVGHIEQFNPAFNAVDFSNIKPTFIEAHRLSPFPNRGTDVPVVLDLMIHDIGVILSIVRKEVKEIRAFGQSIVSDTTDLANARIEFMNGCIVNLTTSRISLKKMRKMRIFQNHRYVNIDFLNKTVDDYKSFNKKPDNNSQNKIFTIDGPNKKYIKHNQIKVPNVDALSVEFDQFINTIKTNNNTGYSGEEATKALSLAIEIQNIIESNTKH